MTTVSTYGKGLLGRGEAMTILGQLWFDLGKGPCIEWFELLWTLVSLKSCPTSTTAKLMLD